MRIIYGINPVREALLKHGANAVERLYSSRRREDRLLLEILGIARSKDIEIRLVDPLELKKISGTQAHQGVLAFIKGEYPYAHIEDAIERWKKSGEPAFFLMLDSIQDPENLGSLIRTANAAGVHAVIIPKDRACQVTPTVVKASAGATEHAMIARVTNLREAMGRLKEEGVWIVGIEGGSEKSIYSIDMKSNIAVVVGSEGSGIRRLIKEGCDYLASIPMKGKINSLNAAQAGGVALFEALRQRGG